MLRQISALEMKIGDKYYKFLCDGDSPLGSVHDALCQMRSYVVERINEANNAQCTKSLSEETVEVINE